MNLPNGQTVTIEERARMQLQLQNAVEMSANVVDSLFVAGGSSALNEGEPLQRCFRDISALRTHYLMDGDRLQENWDGWLSALSHCIARPVYNSRQTEGMR